MARYFAYLSYDGANYHGWQVQPNGESVQAVVERALSLLLRSCITVTAAGRTDAGVNAEIMPVHFDVSGELPFIGRAKVGANCIAEQQLCYKLNSILPRDIAVKKIVRVKDSAHARFSAIRRTYRYFVSLKKDPFRIYSYRVLMPINFDLMNEAATLLLGTHDFDCFAKAHPDVKTSICTVYHARWEQVGDELWCFEISADRFLRNMVRAVVGTLLEIGCGKKDVSLLIPIMESRNRSLAGESVPGKALFLTNVEYPDEIFFEQ